jgi:Fe2+ transport system protein FeoA
MKPAQPAKRAAPAAIQPLTAVAARERVRVHSFGVNGSTVRRLADLGLTIGSTATVVQTSPAAVVLATRGSRLALGRPLAETVFVTAIAPTSGE